jgi:pimeloyl-ACP methyl ester carboxylesterase
MLPAWQDAVRTGDISAFLDQLMGDLSAGSAPQNDAARLHLRDILMDNASSFLHPQVFGVRQDRPASQRLADIHVPTLLIVGDRDDPDLREIADLVVRSITGAHLVVVPRLSRFVNMDRPEEFNRIVLQFLATVSGRPGSDVSAR